MGISGKFLKLWQNHFTVISTSAYSLILVVLEHSIDPNFKCPEDKTWRHIYSLCYILLPPFALLLLGLAVQLPIKREDLPRCECDSCRNSAFCSYFTESKKKNKEKNCERISSICLKAFIPAGLWIIIVLLDGKYVDCEWISPQVNGIAGNPQPGSTPYHYSQIAGLVSIGLTALGGFIYWCRRTRSWKRVPMNESQSRERLRVQATDYLDKQQNEVIRKLIEKHLKDHYLAAPETFVTGLSDEDISFEIRRALNVLWENQSPAGKAQSPAGGAESAAAGAGSAASGAQSVADGAGSAAGRAQSVADGAGSAAGGAESAGDGAERGAAEGIRLLDF